MVFGRLQNYFRTTPPLSQPVSVDSLTVSSDAQGLQTALDWLEQTYRPRLEPDDLWKIQLVVSEWLTNILLYAHQHLPPTTPIQLHGQLHGQPPSKPSGDGESYLQIEVWDYGPPFDLTAQLQTKVQQLEQEAERDHLEDLAEGGRGLFYIQTLTDKLSYYRTTSDPQQNCLQVQKKVRLR